MSIRAFLVGCIAAMLIPVTAMASSHREAPAIANDPAADNTDLYAWINPAGDRLVIVANWIPLEEPAGGPNFHRFSEEVLYEIHIATGGSTEDTNTYQFRFTRPSPKRVDVSDLEAGIAGGHSFFSQLADGPQKAAAWVVLEDGTRLPLGKGYDVAPANIGPRTDAIVNDAPYDDAFADTFMHTLSDGEGFWAGPRDDGFYVDLGGVFDLANLRGPGEAQDGVSGFNVHTIYLSVPLTYLGVDTTAAPDDLGGLLRVWASSSRRQVKIMRPNGRFVTYGPWMQVSRLGLPLINEAIIGFQDKNRFNATHPRDDVANFGAYILNPYMVRAAEAVGIYGALGVPDDVVNSLKSGRVDILDVTSLGFFGAEGYTFMDALHVHVGAPGGFPNGRGIKNASFPAAEQVDVTDISLSLVLSGLTLFAADGVTDNVWNNDKPFLPGPPFLALPHAGFDGGHGTPAPPAGGNDLCEPNECGDSDTDQLGESGFGCYCDDLCDGFGDCCDNKIDVCGAAP